MDLKLELIPVPVSDLDRAKAFYVERAGFACDHDHVVSDELRFIQLTPPGSACSIALITQDDEAMAPGSMRGLQLVADDAGAARDELRGRGVDATDVEHLPWGDFTRFADPDGNTWAVQQIPDAMRP